jgi:hypothetical protein
MLHRREFMQASAGAIAAVGLPGAARAAAWKTIDAQVHCYERNRPERPWAGTLVGTDEMTGDQMVAAMDAVGVGGAVGRVRWASGSSCATMSRPIRQIPA